MNMPAQALVHRNAHALPEHLTEALTYYRQKTQGHLPAKITVHKSLVEAARAALRASTSGQGGIVIEGLGGCLVNEIWLWLPEPEDKENYA